MDEGESGESKRREFRWYQPKNGRERKTTTGGSLWQIAMFDCTLSVSTTGSFGLRYREEELNFAVSGCD